MDTFFLSIVSFLVSSSPETFVKKNSTVHFFRVHSSKNSTLYQYTLSYVNADTAVGLIFSRFWCCCWSFSSPQEDCGDWVAALCDDADGCSDIEGNYDVVMPEPLEGVTGSGYKVRVMDVNDESNTGCSADFTLVASGDSDEAFLVVTAPEAGNMAYAGDEYTVEVSSACRFENIPV